MNLKKIRRDQAAVQGCLWALAWAVRTRPMFESLMVAV